MRFACILHVLSEATRKALPFSTEFRESLFEQVVLCRHMSYSSIERHSDMRSRSKCSVLSAMFKGRRAWCRVSMGASCDCFAQFAASAPATVTSTIPSSHTLLQAAHPHCSAQFLVSQLASQMDFYTVSRCNHSQTVQIVFCSSQTHVVVAAPQPPACRCAHLHGVRPYHHLRVWAAGGC